MSGFEAHGSGAVFHFEGWNPASVEVLSEVPESVVRGEELSSLLYSVKGSQGNWVLSIAEVPDEPPDREYSLIVRGFESSASPPGGGYVEFVRQSEEYLRREFGYQRSGGYWILGRRNIQVRKTTAIVDDDFHGFRPGNARVPLRRAKKRSIPRANVDLQRYKEVELAISLLWRVLALPIATGPSANLSRKYENANFRTRIRLLLNNSNSVQCTGFRDLFAWAATSRGLQVRLIDAFNYYPHFPGLIPYGHSLCEIWIADLDQYILFDPWFGGLMLSCDGAPLCASDLCGDVNPEDIELQCPFPKIRRRLPFRENGSKHNDWHITGLSMDRTVPTKLGGVQPPYVEYFQHVVRREAKITTRASERREALRHLRKRFSWIKSKLIKA